MKDCSLTGHAASHQDTNAERGTMGEGLWGRHPRLPCSREWIPEGSRHGAWLVEVAEGTSVRVKTRATLKPDERGTRKQVAKYGASVRPVSVRRREATAVKTVELIEEESAWEPRGGWTDPDELVEIRVEYREHEVREEVKRAGGWWIAGRRVWRLPRYRAAQLGLEGRIVGRRDLPGVE